MSVFHYLIVLKAALRTAHYHVLPLYQPLNFLIADFAVALRVNRAWKAGLRLMGALRVRS